MFIILPGTLKLQNNLLLSIEYFVILAEVLTINAFHLTKLHWYINTYIWFECNDNTTYKRQDLHRWGNGKITYWNIESNHFMQNILFINFNFFHIETYHGLECNALRENINLKLEAIKNMCCSSSTMAIYSKNPHERGITLII